MNIPNQFISPIFFTIFTLIVISLIVHLINKNDEIKRKIKNDLERKSEDDMSSIFCKKCGNKFDSNSNFCDKCGTPIKQKSYNRPPSAYNNQHTRRDFKEKKTAALLAIFLGGIGAHKFYLGRVSLGVIYLLFCWTLIPAIIGLIEGLVLIVYDQVNFDAEYNR